MKRRKFAVGLGSLAAGGAAATGTGAFSFAQTDRGIDLAVVSDTDAFLAFREGTENSEHASVDDGRINLNFGSDANAGGSGLNEGSVYLFDDVARILNQGTQEVDVSVPETTSDGFWSTNFVAYVGQDGSRQSIWPKDGKTSEFDDLLNNRASSPNSLSDLIDTGPNSAEVDVGNSLHLGVALAIPEDPGYSGKSTQITIRAEEV